jgi:hypothetical protein
MPKVSLAKLERHLLAAADLLRFDGGRFSLRRADRPAPEYRERRDALAVGAADIYWCAP